MTCLNCSREKPDDAILCPSDKQQSNVILVRGLHPNTTRETLVNVFAQFQRQLQDVRLIKDKTTGLSRGFCFVEFYSVPDAAYVLHTAGNQFYVDSQLVSLTFADTTPNRRNGRRPEEYGEDYILNEFLGDTAANEVAAQYLPRNLPPNAQWRFDEQTGYYFEMTSGYYYDYNSGFYFDPTTQLYYQYDPVLGHFVSSDSQMLYNVEPEKPAAAENEIDYFLSAIATTNQKIAASVAVVSHPHPVVEIPAEVVSEVPVMHAQQPEKIEPLPNPVQTSAPTSSTAKPKKKVTTVLSAPTTVPILPPEKEKKVGKSKKPGLTAGLNKQYASDINRWSKKTQELKETEQSQQPQTNQQNQQPQQTTPPSSTPAQPGDLEKEGFGWVLLSPTW
uniref:RRM domain-containing protein n=1 Tax=Arcella intermedia TaxID=1963864 RepID=A0A6B2L0I1_9EUKA